MFFSSPPPASALPKAAHWRKIPSLLYPALLFPANVITGSKKPRGSETAGPDVSVSEERGGISSSAAGSKSLR